MRMAVAAMVSLMIPRLSAEEAVPPEVDVSIAKGLSYLSRQQQADGSFTPLDEQGPRIAPAAGAVLAYLSAGQTPSVGRHALAVRNAVDFIVRQLPEDGDFGRADASGPRGQAIITLALAAIHGMETDAALRKPIHEALERSLHFIRSTQNPAMPAWMSRTPRCCAPPPSPAPPTSPTRAASPTNPA
jgi:hypothetical protein